MNKRNLSCNKKEIFAIGQEGSIADLREKINTCFDCIDFLFCQESNNYFQSIIKQKESLESLEKHYKRNEA